MDTNNLNIDREYIEFPNGKCDRSRRWHCGKEQPTNSINNFLKAIELALFSSFPSLLLAVRQEATHLCGLLCNAVVIIIFEGDRPREHRLK